MPFGGAKLFRRLLVLGEHVLAAHPENVVHRVPGQDKVSEVLG